MRTVLVQHSYTVLTGEDGTASITYDPVLSRVRITVTGLVDPATYRVERSTDQVRWSTVRGGAALAPTLGVVAVDDYEFTPGVENHYRLIGPYAWDLFGRSTASGWGTATSGQTWSGTATQQSVDGATGVVTHDAAAQTITSLLSGDPLGATTYEFTTRVTAVTTGASVDTGLLLRVVNTSNYYLINLIWQPGGTLRLDLLRQVAGSFTTLDSQTLPFGYDGSQSVRIRAEAVGTSIRAMAWLGTPPAAWTVQATDNSHPVGGVGIRSRRNTGNTNSPAPTLWDNMVLSTVDTVVLTGSITPTIDQVWLKSITRPFLNRAVKVVDYSEVERPARNGVFNVIGRTYPVAVTDVRQSRRWTLELYTDTVADADVLDLVFASGDPLFVQVPAGSDIPAGYVVVGDVTRSRYGHLSTRRFFTLPMTEVAAPAPDVVGTTVTWASLLAEFGTWAAVAAAFPTWADVLEYVASPDVVIVP